MVCAMDMRRTSNNFVYLFSQQNQWIHVFASDSVKGHQSIVQNVIRTIPIQVENWIKIVISKGIWFFFVVVF